MKLTEQQNTREAIKNAIEDLEKLNPPFIFVEGNGCICSSCETSKELLQLKLPKGVVKIGDPEESACYGWINVKIGGKKVSINANEIE